jgi:hypothetical protein
MEGLRVRLEEIQWIPLPAPVYIPVQPQVDEAQTRESKDYRPSEARSP